MNYGHYNERTVNELGDKLAGLKVTGTAFDPNEGMVGLTFSDGTLVWVLCDPEGNGPGFLEITTIPKG